MLGFPVSTEFNKRIPKQKFYENLDVSPTLRRVFVDRIKLVYWRNKLAASTLNIAAGEAVTEIEVFEVRLNDPQLDEAVLKQIDKEIPYHILFILTCDGKAQAWIGYKEAAAAGNKRAQLASDMLNYQIKKTIGAYIAAMGGVDAIVFTGGIGEHDAIARAKICHHMDWLGIRIDTEKNKHPVGDVCEITAWGAKVRTLVIATDEELMIARDTKEVIEK